MTSVTHQLKERLAEELADIMLMALRDQAGMYVSTDTFHKRKSELMQIVEGWILT